MDRPVLANSSYGAAARLDQAPIGHPPVSTWDGARLLWPVVILLAAIGAGAVGLGDVESPIRPPLTFLFLLVCPGMAFVRLLRLRDPAVEWPLAIALSTVLDGLIGTALLYSGLWSPNLALLMLIGLSLLGVVLQLGFGPHRVAQQRPALATQQDTWYPEAAPVRAPEAQRSRHFSALLVASIGLLLLRFVFPRWARRHARPRTTRDQL